ncbi:MAG: hypothetical protein WCR80_06780 [Bacilli bacterium]
MFHDEKIKAAIIDRLIHNSKIKLFRGRRLKTKDEKLRECL